MGLPRIDEKGGMRFSLTLELCIGGLHHVEMTENDWLNDFERDFRKSEQRKQLNQASRLADLATIEAGGQAVFESLKTEIQKLADGINERLGSAFITCHRVASTGFLVRKTSPLPSVIMNLEIDLPQRCISVNYEHALSISERQPDVNLRLNFEVRDGQISLSFNGEHDSTCNLEQIARRLLEPFRESFLNRRY